ncbi:MAG: nitrite reductase small subunit NirD [Halioglobus sp.]
MTAAKKIVWQKVCGVADLVTNSGVCALVGREQIALFYLPAETPAVYALHNHDPIGEANVLARGIVGDIGGELVVASPLYKQHFSLTSGQCLEDEDTAVPSYAVKIEGDEVLIRV